VALAALQPDWQLAFTILAVVTMTFGNVVAVAQTSVKRMLAYSSLAQAGYIAMAFAVMTPVALTGGIMYALAHAFMKAGAFIAAGVVVWMVSSEKTGNLDVPDHLDSFRGLGKRMGRHDLACSDCNPEQCPFTVLLRTACEIHVLHAPRG